MKNRECLQILGIFFFSNCLPFKSAPSLFTPQLIEQLKLNVYYYAELLFRWQMYHKRLELLKAVNRRDGMLVPIKTEINRIGTSTQFSHKLHVMD